MNRLLHLIICILLVSPLWGQLSVSVEPGTFVLNGNPSSTDMVYHVDVVNNSNIDVYLHWSRIVPNAPAGWLTWICDKNLCYLPTANASSPTKPNILSPGEHMDFQIHVNPQALEGCTDYTVNFTDQNDPKVILATLTGQVCASNSVSTKDETSSAKLTVFPNPTADFFQVSGISGLSKIELFNIVGNKIKSFDTAPQKQYYVGDLNEGIYLVRLVSSSNKVLKTIRLSVR